MHPGLAVCCQAPCTTLITSDGHGTNLSYIPGASIGETKPKHHFSGQPNIPLCVKIL